MIKVTRGDATSLQDKRSSIRMPRMAAEQVLWMVTTGIKPLQVVWKRHQDAVVASMVSRIQVAHYKVAPYDSSTATL